MTNEETYGLTTEMIEAIEGMVSRRMEGAGETRKQASDFLANFFRKRADGIRASQLK